MKNISSSFSKPDRVGRSLHRYRNALGLRPGALSIFAAALCWLASPAGLPAQSSSNDGQAARLIDLAETFRLVDSQNLDLAAARQGVLGTAQNIVRERARLLPSVDLRASQMRAQTTNSSLAKLFGASGDTGVGNRFDGKLAATVPLVDAKALTDWKVAKFNNEVAELDLDGLRQDLFAAAAEFYYTVLRNEASLAVIHANMERDQTLLELARNQFQAGVATPIDVTRAEVRLAADQQDLLRQETALLESQLNFKRLLKLDYGEPIALQESGLPNEPPQLRQSELAGILQARPDYRKALRELDRNRYARRMAPWEQAPNVALVGDYGAADSELWNNAWQEEWSVGVTFSMPVFDGFRIRANKIQADTLIRQQEAVLQSIANQVEANYRLSLQDVAARFQEIKVARLQVDLSEKELALARTRFQEGVSDNRDVVEAQANLALANDGLVDAIFRYHLSRVSQARVFGEVRRLAAE